MQEENKSLPPEVGNPAPAASPQNNSNANVSASLAWERETLERLVMAQLVEQRTARRWRIGFRLFWTLLLMGGLWYSFHHGKSSVKNTHPSSHTALIEIKGEIDSDTNANAEWIIDSMRQAFEDEGAQAVVLLINSPGGSPVQAGMINDKIFVDKASIVGSIGVLMDGFGFTGLMDKVGIERRLMTAGENKGFLDPFSTPTKTQKTHAQHMLDQIHQQFIAVVRDGRGDRLKESPEIFSGLFWSGQQAIELGLADGYGTLDSVARDVVKAEDIVDYTHQDNVAERLAKRFGAAVGEAVVKSSLHLVPHIR